MTGTIPRDRSGQTVGTSHDEGWVEIAGTCPDSPAVLNHPFPGDPLVPLLLL